MIDSPKETSACLFANISISHRQHSRANKGLKIFISEGPGVWSFVIRLARGMTPHSSISSGTCDEPTGDVHATWQPASTQCLDRLPVDRSGLGRNSHANPDEFLKRC